MRTENRGPAIANSQGAIAEAARAHKAMTILRLLDGDVLRGAANDQLLQTLLSLLGLRTSKDEIREVIDDLEKEGAIQSSPAEELLVVQLTHHGHELALGLVRADGIERPQFPSN